MPVFAVDLPDQRSPTPSPPAAVVARGAPPSHPHDHGHGRSTTGRSPARRVVRVRPSLLRFGLLVRLAGAGAVAALLWALVLGVAP